MVRVGESAGGLFGLGNESLHTAKKLNGRYLVASCKMRCACWTFVYSAKFSRTRFIFKVTKLCLG